ncbi:MAG: hypothetical protein JXB26_04075 [Candidatus Aminicenantes bacterium]|nr:hypothetical protein [Candidatus Aminicenantes bacterium]
MSAICGIIHFDRNAEAHDALEKMMESLAYRGKDGSHKWVDKSVAMGHQMLYSTPESLYETLPVSSENGRLLLNADARIDNREELFKKLFITTSNRQNISDNVLILKSYEQWGTHCPEHLLGEFVFVIWDFSQQKLFAARDHIGFRPLYYYYSGDRFIFSSEMKQVLNTAGLPYHINEKALIESIYMRLTNNEITFFNNIKQIPPAHSITVSQRGLKKRQYWNPQTQPRIKFSSNDEYAEALRELVKQSVHARMRSTFPIAIQLSGGLDSSAVAVIAARKLMEERKSLIAVSSVLDPNHSGQEKDDREHIDLIVHQEKNIKINYVTPDGLSLFDNFEKLFEQYYAPIDDPFYFMDHALLSNASNLGARIMLNGCGGDMAASHHGQKAIFQLIKEMRWITAYDLLQKKKSLESKSMPRLIYKEILSNLFPDSLKDIIKKARGLPSSYLKDLSLFSKNIIQTKSFNQNFQHFMHLLRPAPTPCENILRGILPQSDYGNILAYMTNTGGQFSINTTSPLADKRIIEFMLRIPPEIYILDGWTRGLFRRAMEGILPPKIQWRQSKHPFAPNFHSKMIQSKHKIHQLLSSSERTFLEKKYINKRSILQQLNNIKPCTGFNDWDNKTQHILFKGAMIISFLRWIDYKRNH